MAQLDVTQDLGHRIELYLALLFEAWERVPEYVRAWEEWDEDDRLVFVTEWPINEEELDELRSWSKQGLLSDDQEQRLGRLEALIARNRPLIDPLLAA